MPEKPSIHQGRLYKERLISLREEMQRDDLDGYILPRTDEFQGEFLAEYAERLAWITGFTGSAGMLGVLHDDAVVMSDGRYTTQLSAQVNAELYMTADMIQEPIGQWLAAHAEQGARIGYDLWLFTPQQLEKVKEHTDVKGIELVGLDYNLIDSIWQDQPARPSSTVTLFPDEVAGRRSAEKRGLIAQQIIEKDCDFCILTSGDSICWLLNIRGGDVVHSPLPLSYLFIYKDGSVDWFIDKEKVGQDVLSVLGQHVQICDFTDIKIMLRAPYEKVWIDPKSTPVWFVQLLEQRGVDIIYEDDPCAYPKAIKTPQEIEAMRKAHILDGVAVTRFLKWAHDNNNKTDIDELSVETTLEELRAENADFIEASFATIAGFNANGAIIHYRATPESNQNIVGNGLLLVDSGGQYRWGTTDITRTIAIGIPSNEMKENYTRVLKGHIAVASAVFPKETPGKDIDALARQALMDVGLNYAHGTGHGVGCYLCVHESATHISPKEDRPFAAGMIISNEPGYYKEGEYGIRIENLVLVAEYDATHFCFETLSYAPFDLDLICVDMLTMQEKQWLNDYLESIKMNLGSRLSVEERQWLTT